MILTCAIGKLEFDDNINISTAKLIRDAIMGSILNPRDGTKLKTQEDCFRYAKDYHPEGYKLSSVIILSRTNNGGKQ